LLLLIFYGPTPFYLLWSVSTSEDPPQELKIYQDEKDYSFSGYELSADFLDQENSNVVHMSPLTFFRQDPALELNIQDYDKACISKIESDYIIVAFKLLPQIKQKLLTEFKNQDEKYRAFAHGDYEQRFILEGAGNTFAWFWMTDPGVRQYEEALTEQPGNFDFSLKIPYAQLYDFQFLLMNYVSDVPLKGCSAEIDLQKLPYWDALIELAWHGRARN